MLNIIGIGLNEKGITIEGLGIVRKCSKVYLENYTINLPYKLEKIEKVIKKKITTLSREEVESDYLIKEAKNKEIALLVYGSPLFATTHISLIMDAKKQRVKTKIIYSSSIFDAVSETGLQSYKFGKIASMPKWQKNFTPDSFLNIINENLSIKAHTLLLSDISLNLYDALYQLEESIKRRNGEIKIDKILVCSNMGNDSKIYYKTISELKKISKKVKLPFSLIIPGELHFLEEEAIKRFL